MPDFAEIKARCNGMMSAGVYERIYSAALEAPEGLFVEVGTGHGAATVAMALALRERGSAGKVHTFDRMEGGSRSRYGNRETNLGLARQAFDHFGVSDRIELVVGDVAETASKLPEGPIGLLFLDCDGRIDRDLRTFGDRMPEGAPIVIDDMADKVRMKPRGQTFRIDQKHRLTFLLVNAAVEHGQMIERGTVGNTWFGAKGSAAFRDWPDASVLAAYRQLVFADARPC